MRTVTQLTMLVVLLSAANVSSAQQTPAPQQSPAPQADQGDTHEAEFSRLAVNGAIFIYRTPVDPCAPISPGPTALLPLGSGFVVGVESTDSTPQHWHGWKFLVTAKHILANQSEVIVRVNAANGSKFICKTLAIHPQDNQSNVVFGPDGVDLVALWLPDIDGADPTVVPSAMLIDESQMKKSSIGVGTQVVTVGYLFGFSGQKANFPVMKFGHVSAVTDEAWFYNKETRLSEQGYVVDLPNAPGLSGAPVFAHGVEIETSPGLRYRQLPPYVVGASIGASANKCAAGDHDFAGCSGHRARP